MPSLLTQEQGRVTLAGTGIRFLAHLSKETEQLIQSADQLFYLVNDPLMAKWLKTTNPNSHSLEPIYFQHHNRNMAYQAITDTIIQNLAPGKHNGIILYGHPCVFSQSGLAAIKRAAKMGYISNILPAISAEDCLYADLQIDPGQVGCQSFEATDFLLYQRQFDPCCHLILWQADVIGATAHRKTCSQHGLKILTQHLSKSYALTHPVTLYEAPPYPGFTAKTSTTTLSALAIQELSPTTTLYIPPQRQRDADPEMLKLLGL